MARTTLIVLFIASLCFIGESAPVTPGVVKGLIRKAEGRSLGAMNAIVGRAIKEQNKDVTLTPAQRECIATSASTGRANGHQQIEQAAQQLLIEYQNVPATASIPQIKAEIDSQMNQVVEAVVKTAISTMQSC